MEKSKKLVVSIFLLLLAAGTSYAQPSAAGVRDIDNQNLLAGQSTTVTVTITNAKSQALAFQESLPSGWTLTRISDDANIFKEGTNEWVWFNAGAGAEKTIKYMLTVPSDAAPAAYTIQGSVSNSSGIIASVTGENSIRIGNEGDLNGNGRIDIGDAAMVAHMVVGKIPQDLSADFNNNNRVDIGDATKIAYFLVGKVNEL